MVALFPVGTASKKIHRRDAEAQRRRGTTDEHGSEGMNTDAGRALEAQ